MDCFLKFKNDFELFEIDIIILLGMFYFDYF